MGALGVICMVTGVMAVVSSVNGRLPLVLAALFGQGAPVAPTYNSLSQTPSSAGWTGAGAFTPEDVSSIGAGVDF